MNCTLITTLAPDEARRLKTNWNMLATRPSGTSGLDAVKLGVLANQDFHDIIHIVGTNAIVFSPVYKLLGAHGAIIRQIFTPYDRKDSIVRPIRWIVNNLFVDAYAFTTPWIGRWERDLGPGMRKLLLRPPIDCELYRKTDKKGNGPVVGSHQYTLLYMGPLWPSRFPAQSILGALRLLLRNGFDVGLYVLTSARSSVELCEQVSSLGNRLGVDRNLVLERRDLSEIERVRAYNAADAMIFPYVGPEPEQLADPPFGILESMACGKVVLATPVLSVPEVVTDGITGFIARSSSVEDIQHGLIRALTSPDREDVGFRAREKIVSHFSYDAVRPSLVEAYESVLER